ncbi:hypothetical protein [Halovivax limisalsi]|uniref:hypothetical protein n=1 Tax=Halovivax limisalsi TaxID=1453760 RepID=UPI001FFD5E6E|nr:hypothetical protein [Halovivax limisalsi]
MHRIVNVHTNTIHRASENPVAQRTTCGALRHVPSHHVERLGEDGPPADASRCGRCFDDAGGY